MQKSEFSASWDSLVKGMTTVVFVLLISLTVLFSCISNNMFLMGTLTILYGSILFFPYLWSPRGYGISDRGIVVKRLIGDLTIHICREPKRWHWTWWGLRLFGSGDLYGYFGLFTLKGIGRVWMHATNRNNLVLVKDVRGTKYLLSPDDPDKFIQQTRGLLSSTNR